MMQRMGEKIIVGTALSGFVYFGRAKMLEIVLVAGSVVLTCFVVVAARIAYIASHARVVVQKKE